MNYRHATVCFVVFANYSLRNTEDIRLRYNLLQFIVLLFTFPRILRIVYRAVVIYNRLRDFC